MIKRKNIFFILAIILTASVLFPENEIKIKKLNFTCITIHNKKDISLTKNTASSNLANFLAGYFYGINFNIQNNTVKTIINSQISLKNKQSEFKTVNINDTIYLIETGSIEYNAPNVEKFMNNYTVRETLTGDDFWMIYQKLTVKAIQKNIKNNSSGIVIPAGELSVDIDEETGLITVSETFNIYEF